MSSASAVRAFSHSAPTALNNPKRSSPGDELARLRDEVANLRVKNDRLRDTNDRLRATNDRLENENASLFSQCKEEMPRTPSSRMSSTARWTFPSFVVASATSW